MKISTHTHRALASSAWKDIVSDFLEMACFLNNDEQTTLMSALQNENILADEIRVYPCFSISGCLIIICEESFNGPVIQNEKAWLYYPKRKEIKRLAL